MSLSFYCKVAWTAVVSVAQSVVRLVVQAVQGLVSVVQRTARAGWNLLRAAWQHPIITATAVGTSIAAWLVFGWVPLLSACAVVATLYLTTRLTIRLYRWLRARRASAPQQAPITPHRNGPPRMNRSPGSACAGVA